MPLTLGTTGMDSKTEADVRAAFDVANQGTGGQWTLAADDNADFVVVDMDSLYGPMSWLRLHAAGRKVIGLSSVERRQTDYRLPRPVDAEDFAALLRELATDAPVGEAPAAQGPASEAAPSASTPAPAPSDHLPEPAALAVDEIEAAPDPMPAMAVAPMEAEPKPGPPPAPEPVREQPLPPDRPLASWLSHGLQQRVRLQRADAPPLLIDPQGQTYHGPATLKPVAPYFEGTLLIEDFKPVAADEWARESATLGAPQPLVRLQWLGGLLAGRGELDAGMDPNGQYRLGKWPQTEREYPKHFRIATAMMRGPSTVAEIAAASGVDRQDVADFVNANLATGFAEPVRPAAQEPPPGTRQGSGLFDRMRGR